MNYDPYLEARRAKETPKKSDKIFDEYLPDDTRALVHRVGGFISKELRRDVNKIRMARRLQWNHVINACLKKFRDDNADLSAPLDPAYEAEVGFELAMEQELPMNY